MDQLTEQELKDMPKHVQEKHKEYEKLMADVEAMTKTGGAEGEAVLASTSTEEPVKSTSEKGDEAKLEATAEASGPDNPSTPKSEGEADSGAGEQEAPKADKEHWRGEAERARHNAKMTAGRLEKAAEALRAKKEQTKTLEEELASLREQVEALKKAPAPVPSGPEAAAGQDKGAVDLNTRLLEALTQMLDDPEAADKVDVAGAIAEITDSKLVPHIEQIKLLQKALDEQRANEASEAFWLKVVTANPNFNKTTESPGFAEFLKESLYGVSREELWNKAIERGDYTAVGEIAADYESAQGEADEPKGRSSRLADRASVMSPAPGHPPRKSGPKTYTLAEWTQKKQDVQNRMRKPEQYDSAVAEHQELMAAWLGGRVT